MPAEDHQQLKAWSADFAELLGNFQHNPDRVRQGLASLRDLTGYIRDKMADQARFPRDGLIGSLMAAEVDGARLSEEEVIANTIVTMVGGQETTTNLIGNGLLTLLRQPDTLAQLRDEPGIIGPAVEELLRYESPSQHTARLAPDDVVLGGKPIRKGARGDGRDGGRQPRPGALPRPGPAGPAPHRQPAPGLRLGRAFLLRCPPGAHGGPDRLQRLAAPLARPGSGHGRAGLA